jgi:hypothetical protein
MVPAIMAVAPMSTPHPPDSADAPGRSGRAFVLVCLGLCAALVLGLVFVSPRLLQATLAESPDPTPVEVATGEVDGRNWTVTAVRPGEERSCAEVAVEGQRRRLVCGNERGPSGLRAMDAIGVGQAAIITAVVDPRSTEMAVAHAGATTRTEVVYANFVNFPLGFAAVAVAPPVTRVSAYGEQGQLRGRADCRLDGDDHDPQRHVAAPIVVGTGEALTGGCLLTD